MRRQQKGIFSCRRWHNVGELPMYGEFSGYPFTHLQKSFTVTSGLTSTSLYTNRANLLLTRSDGPTSGHSHLSHCHPCPPLLLHPLTGLPVSQRWGCWHRPLVPGRGRCCVAFPPLNLPWQGGLRCSCPRFRSWSCFCWLFHCRAPCHLGPGLLGCYHWSPAGRWPRYLKHSDGDNQTTKISKNKFSAVEQWWLWQSVGWQVSFLVH